MTIPNCGVTALALTPTTHTPLSDFGAITGTSVNGGNALNYYYFFYDWKVSVDAVGCSLGSACP